MNYTIAVIASGIDEEYQQSILRGIHLYAAQHNVNIAHFIAFGGILSNRKYDHGEYNIYQLPNFSLFDGVILLSNTFPSEISLRRSCALYNIPDSDAWRTTLFSSAR